MNQTAQALASSPDEPSTGLMIAAGALAAMYGLVLLAKIKPNRRRRRRR